MYPRTVPYQAGKVANPYLAQGSGLDSMNLDPQHSCSAMELCMKDWLRGTTVWENVFFLPKTFWIFVHFKDWSGSGFRETPGTRIHLIWIRKNKGGFFLDFFFFMYDIQHCFICRPSDSSVSEDAGIESRTVATIALAVRRSNHSARSHPPTQLDLIQII